MPSDQQTYTGNNHVLGRGIHIAFSNPSVLLKRGREKWLLEWHHYFGPIRLHGKTKEPLEKQPDEKSWFWRVAQWWKDQGCRVVDGVGVWDYPPVIETRWTQIGKRSYVADPNGERIRKQWQGYESWGFHE